MRDSDERGSVTPIPNWFLAFLTVMVLPFAYGAFAIATDVAVIKQSITTVLDKIIEQDERIDRIDNRVRELEAR